MCTLFFSMTHAKFYYLCTKFEHVFQKNLPSCAYENCYLNGQFVTTVRHGEHDLDPQILIKRKSNFEIRSRCLKTLEQRSVICDDISTKTEYRGIFDDQNTEAINGRMRTC